ncbi:hypothetical protein K440DRAFT_642413 [Wilcoxina mikolae CBS 423.85]|nr:hypothetical protein K440DRAFT_642413 [Wilcoxina mikolae CBS 423.85]
MRSEELWWYPGPEAEAPQHRGNYCTRGGYPAGYQTCQPRSADGLKKSLQPGKRLLPSSRPSSVPSFAPWWTESCQAINQLGWQRSCTGSATVSYSEHGAWSSRDLATSVSARSLPKLERGSSTISSFQPLGSRRGQYTYHQPIWSHKKTKTLGPRRCKRCFSELVSAPSGTAVHATGPLHAAKKLKEYRYRGGGFGGCRGIPGFEEIPCSYGTDFWSGKAEVHHFELPSSFEQPFVPATLLLPSDRLVVFPGELDVIKKLAILLTFQEDDKDRGAILGLVTPRLEAMGRVCGTVECGQIGVDFDGFREDWALIKLNEGWKGVNGEWWAEDSWEMLRRSVEIHQKGIFMGEVRSIEDPVLGRNDIWYEDGDTTGWTAGQFVNTEV